MALPKFTFPLLLVAAAAATLSTGCVVGSGNTRTVNMAEPIRVPADARLIAYGKYFPATMVPDHGGTLYFYEEETGKLAYVLTLNFVDTTQPMVLKDLPSESQDNFQPDHHYRVYFAATPTAHPAATSDCAACDSKSKSK